MYVTKSSEKRAVRKYNLPTMRVSVVNPGMFLKCTPSLRTEALFASVKKNDEKRPLNVFCQNDLGGVSLAWPIYRMTFSQFQSRVFPHAKFFKAFRLPCKAFSIDFASCHLCTDPSKTNDTCSSAYELQVMMPRFLLFCTFVQPKFYTYSCQSLSKTNKIKKTHGSHSK